MLWLRLGHEAYTKRQLVRALNYFHRALNYTRERGLNSELALVCRDLGYVYAHEEALDEAITCFDEGLAISEVELATRAGLMANKASVLARLGAYREAANLLKKSSHLIHSSYPDFSRAPGKLIRSYAAIVRMAEDLQRVVELLDMGIRAERIQVEIKRSEPPWLRSEY